MLSRLFVQDEADEACASPVTGFDERLKWILQQRPKSVNRKAYLGYRAKGLFTKCDIFSDTARHQMPSE
jgi:hypothetical protein